MSSAPIHASGAGEQPIIFACPGCGLKLSVPRNLAGVSGPCPSCGSVATAPGGLALMPFEVVSERGSFPAKTSLPAGGFPERSRPAHSGRRKGTISADSMVDHEHLNRRETMKTLGIITMFILAFCACLAVAWFMKG